MGSYYLAVNRVYGGYLLCLYFEFFREFLEPNQKEENAVAELRKYLLEIPRWPEMITFEELNVSDPTTKYSIGRLTTLAILKKATCSAMAENGFIFGAEQILKNKS